MGDGGGGDGGSSVEKDTKGKVIFFFGGGGTPLGKEGKEGKRSQGENFENEDYDAIYSRGFGEWSGGVCAEWSVLLIKTSSKRGRKERSLSFQSCLLPPLQTTTDSPSSLPIFFQLSISSRLLSSLLASSTFLPFPQRSRSSIYFQPSLPVFLFR